MAFTPVATLPARLVAVSRSAFQPAVWGQVHRVHVCNIPSFLGRLQHHGMMGKTRIIQQQTKGLDAQAALADTGVPITREPNGFKLSFR